MPFHPGSSSDTGSLQILVSSCLLALHAWSSLAGHTHELPGRAVWVFISWPTSLLHPASADLRYSQQLAPADLILFSPPSPAWHLLAGYRCAHRTESTLTQRIVRNRHRTGCGDHVQSLARQARCPVACLHETCLLFPLHFPCLLLPNLPWLLPFLPFIIPLNIPQKFWSPSSPPKYPVKPLSSYKTHSNLLFFSSVTKLWLTLFKDTPERFLLWPITNVLRVLAFVTVPDSSCYCLCICVLKFIILAGFCLCLLCWIAANYVFFQSA